MLWPEIGNRISYTPHAMFYPAHLNLQNRKCLVVGGGKVAERKVRSLLLSSGNVTLISPDATESLKNLAQIGQVVWHRRQFQTNDTVGMFLVCAATDFSEINTQIFKDAYDANEIRLVNVVDVIPECTFAAASVVMLENLAISISTSGKSPAMSRRIREYLEAKFGTRSLYKLERNGNTIPIENRRVPYPVYLLLENRRCVVIRNAGKMSQEMVWRIDLLRRCRASITCIDPTDVDSHLLSDAFLVLTDLECEGPVFTGNQIQLIENLNSPEAGTFVTPSLVIDDNLIISISTQSENAADGSEVRRIRTELAEKFENTGYGAFIDFLGELRPLVLKSIRSQEKRQQFFDTLIDRIPDVTINEQQTCCLGFTNTACTTECVFNWVHRGQIEHAHQYALQQIRKRKIGKLGS